MVKASSFDFPWIGDLLKSLEGNYWGLPNNSLHRKAPKPPEPKSSTVRFDSSLVIPPCSTNSFRYYSASLVPGNQNRAQVSIKYRFEKMHTSASISGCPHDIHAMCNFETLLYLHQCIRFHFSQKILFFLRVLS